MNRNIARHFSGEAAHFDTRGFFNCPLAQWRSIGVISERGSENEYFVAGARLHFSEAADLSFQASNARHVRVRDVNYSHYASVCHRSEERRVGKECSPIIAPQSQLHTNQMTII